MKYSVSLEAQKMIFLFMMSIKDEKVVIGGLAIDIGTTTVSALLIDMKSEKFLERLLPEMDRFDMEQMLSIVLLNL